MHTRQLKSAGDSRHPLPGCSLSRLLLPYPAAPDAALPHVLLPCCYRAALPLQSGLWWWQLRRLCRVHWLAGPCTTQRAMWNFRADDKAPSVVAHPPMPQQAAGSN